jgi:hypothetical protein
MRVKNDFIFRRDLLKWEQNACNEEQSRAWVELQSDYVLEALRVNIIQYMLLINTLRDTSRD